MYKRTRGLLLGLAGLAACGDKGDDSGETALPDPWTEFYAVESDIDAGGFSFQERYWARRSVDPAASTIDEEFIAAADGTLTTTVLTVDAAAGTFSLVINDGEYTGEGTLYGEAWAWTSWESRSTATDGTYVLSEDAVTSTGIEASKVGYSTADEPEWTLTEVLTTISEADWQAGVDASGR